MAQKHIILHIQSIVVRYLDGLDKGLHRPAVLYVVIDQRTGDEPFQVHCVPLGNLSYDVLHFNHTFQV